MISAAVYSKTAMGEEELRAPARRISQAARQLLIVIDGKRSLDDLVSLFGPQTVASHLSTLESGGFVQRREPSRNTLSGRSAERTAELTRTPGIPIIPIGIAFALGLVAAAGILTSRSKAPQPGPEALADAGKDTAAVAGTLSMAPEALPEGAPTARGRPASTATHAPANPPAIRAGASSSPALSGSGARLAGLGPAPAPATAAGSRPDPASSTIAASNPAPAQAAPVPYPPPVAEAAATPEAGAATFAPALSSANPTRMTAAAAAPASAIGAAPAAGQSASATLPRGSTEASTSPAGSSTSSLTTAVAAATAASTAGSASASTNASAPPVELHVRTREIPEMPRKARRAGVVEGRLVARLEVNPGGTVEAVQLESAQPSSVYDDNVRAALARWTFDPPGRTVRTRIAITFRP